jgi:hypothetical protein
MTVVSSQFLISVVRILLQYNMKSYYYLGSSHYVKELYVTGISCITVKFVLCLLNCEERNISYHGKKPLGRPKCRWEYIIKIDLREIVWKCVDWCHITQGRGQWQAFVNTVTGREFLD